jgi:hypothetical protein
MAKDGFLFLFFRTICCGDELNNRHLSRHRRISKAIGQRAVDRCMNIPHK